MRRKEEKNTIIEICPVRNVIARFGNKWALLVILILSENKVLRFSELKKMIPDVSSRMLSSTLRTLEADGLVSRKVYPEVPPKVEYSLTETGLSLVPFIVQLTEWAQKHMKSIVNAAKKLFSLYESTLSLMATPGVTNSVIPLFTSFFVSFGSSNWSQMATRLPARISFGK